MRTEFFGKYWTIVGFSIPYILGHVILGIESFTFMAIALTLLAMGSGVIKPNISTLMGLTYDQQRAGQTKLRSDAFAIFYFAINIGAALSQFAMPPLPRDAYGYAIAFLFPGRSDGHRLHHPLRSRARSTTCQGGGSRTQGSDAGGEGRTLAHPGTGCFSLFILVMFFWAIFDQASSTWIFFAEAMHGHICLFGVEVAPDQIQAFNPVFILILLPPITQFIK